jgi:hypothetical protein
MPHSSIQGRCGKLDVRPNQSEGLSTNHSRGALKHSGTLDRYDYFEVGFEWVSSRQAMS